jgi:hypothetical protein
MPGKPRLVFRKPLAPVTPIPAVVIIPRVLNVPNAARYLSATINLVDELVRKGEVRSFMQGKERVIDCRELDRYVERRNSEPAQKLTERADNFNKAA